MRGSMYLTIFNKSKVNRAESFQILLFQQSLLPSCSSGSINLLFRALLPAGTPSVCAPAKQQERVNNTSRLTRPFIPDFVLCVFLLIWLMQLFVTWELTIQCFIWPFISLAKLLQSLWPFAMFMTRCLQLIALVKEWSSDRVWGARNQARFLTKTF